MNSSFMTWAVVAGAAALVILLMLGSPTGETADAALDEAATEVAADDRTVEATEVATTSYWEPVTRGGTPTAYVTGVATSSTTSPCPACGSLEMAPPAAPVLRGGCGTPAGACVLRPCSVCGATAATPVTVVPVTSGPMVGGCGTPVSACPIEPCGAIAARCANPCGSPCEDPCGVIQPKINRNMPLCIDECEFIQLRSTVPYPLSQCVSFQWAASRGSFLDATASDPIYFAPTTHFPCGEEVWITLTVTDVNGAQYSDVASLRVNDVR